MDKLKIIKQSTRWKGLSHGKIPLFCVVSFYLILKTHMFSSQAVVDFLLFFGFAILSGIYGYLINDLFDMEIDREHQKKNVFENVGKRKGSALILALLILSVVVGLRFLPKPYFLFSWIIWIFLATFYSARPLRLKEKGALGLIANTLSQYTFPIILCFSAFNSFGTLDMWGFILFSTVSGITQETGHQRFDMASDNKTSTRTFAVRIGQKNVDNLYRFLLGCDLVSIMGMMLLMAWNTRHIPLLFAGGNVFIPVIALYCILVFLTVKRMFLFRDPSNFLDPYYQLGRQDILNITYTLFPNFFLPTYLSLILLINYPLFLAFVVFMILITFISFPGANFLRPVQVILSEARSFIEK